MFDIKKEAATTELLTTTVFLPKQGLLSEMFRSSICMLEIFIYLHKYVVFTNLVVFSNLTNIQKKVADFFFPVSNGHSVGPRVTKKH